MFINCTGYNTESCIKITVYANARVMYITQMMYLDIFLKHLNILEYS